MLPCLWACVPPTVHVLCAVLADCAVASGTYWEACQHMSPWPVRGARCVEIQAAVTDPLCGRLRASPGRVLSKNDWAQSITLQLTGYQMSTAMAIAEASARD